MCSGQIGESWGEKTGIFGGNGEEKGFGEVESEEVEGKDVYIPERGFVRWKAYSESITRRLLCYATFAQPSQKREICWCRLKMSFDNECRQLPNWWISVKRKWEKEWENGFERD